MSHTHCTCKGGCWTYKTHPCTWSVCELNQLLETECFSGHSSKWYAKPGNMIICTGSSKIKLSAGDMYRGIQCIRVISVVTSTCVHGFQAPGACSIELSGNQSNHTQVW